MGGLEPRKLDEGAIVIELGSIAAALRNFLPLH
jgi:hypothetical protein